MDHEQRIDMKFCFKLQKNAKETHEMLILVNGDDAVTMKTVYKWFERFRNGCESVEDDERSGHPSTSKTQENVENVSEMIRSHRRLTIREITEDLNISYGSVQNIVTTDLNMRRVGAIFDNAPCHTSVLVRQFLSNNGNFCQTKILLFVLIHLVHRISHRATSGSSTKSKSPWRVNGLNQFRTSRQPRQHK